MLNTHPVPTADIDMAKTSPDTIAGRYLRRFWLPVAELADVAPGRANANR